MPTVDGTRLYLYDNVKGEDLVIDDKRLPESRCLVVIDKNILSFKRGDKLVIMKAISQAIGLT